MVRLVSVSKHEINIVVWENQDWGFWRNFTYFGLLGQTLEIPAEARAFILNIFTVVKSGRSCQLSRHIQTLRQWDRRADRRMKWKTVTQQCRQMYHFLFVFHLSTWRVKSSFFDTSCDHWHTSRMQNPRSHFKFPRVCLWMCVSVCCALSVIKGLGEMIFNSVCNPGRFVCFQPSY